MRTGWQFPFFTLKDLLNMIRTSCSLDREQPALEPLAVLLWCCKCRSEIVPRPVSYRLNVSFCTTAGRSPVKPNNTGTIRPVCFELSGEIYSGKQLEFFSQQKAQAHTESVAKQGRVQSDKYSQILFSLRRSKSILRSALAVLC